MVTIKEIKMRILKNKEDWPLIIVTIIMFILTALAVSVAP